MFEKTVCIDGFNLALPKGTGVATYSRTLAKTLHSCDYKVEMLYGLNIPSDAPQNLKEVLFFNELGAGNSPYLPKVFSLKWFRELIHLKKWEAQEIKISGCVETRGTKNRLPVHDNLFNIRNLFERAHRYYKLTKRFLTIELPSAPAIMHWTYPLPIRVSNAVNVYTIHDLVPLNLPQTTLDDKGYYYRMIKDICCSEDYIVTVSEYSKRSIISFFPDVKERIYNSYQTVDDFFAHNVGGDFSSENEVKKLFNIEKNSYFLFFGSLEPKKNIGRIIEAFLLSSSERKLVIVGAMGWKNENELRFLKHGIDMKRIIYIDYLPSHLLVAILRSARALLFPSIAEGFGLPVLEAFLCGTPVLSSHEGGLTEVANDAALIVDAYDINSIARGIDLLDSDTNLCSILKEKGYRQAEFFSSSEYSGRIKSIYNDIIRKKTQ